MYGIGLKLLGATLPRLKLFLLSRKIRAGRAARVTIRLWPEEIDFPLRSRKPGAV